MVEICYCADDEMVTITKDGKSVFSGNYWDLPTGPVTLNLLLNKLGLQTTLIEEIRSEPFEDI